MLSSLGFMGLSAAVVICVIYYLDSQGEFDKKS